MKKLCIILSVLISTSFFICDSGSSGNDSANNNDDVDNLNISSELGSPGNSVELTAADGSSVKGVVVDTDGDEVGDGLDFNADDSPEMIYVEGAFSTKAFDKKCFCVKDDITFIPFTIAGDDTVYYFRVVSDEIGIFTDEAGNSEEVVLVMEADSIVGFSTDGSGEPDVPRS